TMAVGGEGDLVEVLPLAGIDHALAYRVPPHLTGRIQPGCLVRVPLRHGLVLGLVERLGTDQDVPAAKVKNIFELLFPEPILTPDLLALAKWIAGYYLAPLEAVFEAMIPVPVRAGMAMKLERRLRAGRLELTVEELAALERRAKKQATVYKFL